MKLKFGLYLSNYGKAINARALSKLAAEAETAGWDGFFLWDHILGGRTTKNPMVDPWVALAAMVMTTERIRLGTTVTPIARRRPWKLARETITLDHLSGGRLTLSVGLGAPDQAEFAAFGEDADRRVRAEKLDEGLEILTGLWKGSPFSYQGEHYQLDKMIFRPATFQQPRIPIWVGGYWPNPAPFHRAARYDGVFPLKHNGALTANDLRDMCAFIQQHRTTDDPFDIVMAGYSHGETQKQVRKKLRPFAEVGMTWWLESLFRQKDSYEDLLIHIRQGPPQMD
ncbi:MAG TPA: LLM class flavin-dependent oxidoreductase [Anaerolineales bacterium]|nr:LLM class flavin-dependent oxidoreductase [Anaerolineales bacterium]